MTFLFYLLLLVLWGWSGGFQDDDNGEVSSSGISGRDYRRRDQIFSDALEDVSEVNPSQSRRIKNTLMRILLLLFHVVAIVIVVVYNYAWFSEIDPNTVFSFIQSCKNWPDALKKFILSFNFLLNKGYLGILQKRLIKEQSSARHQTS